MSARTVKRAARLPRAQRIEEILDAAREVFCERGYEDTAVAEIAARIGVVEGTIFKYFENKRELLLKVLGNWYDELFGDYSQDLRGINGAKNRFRYLIWRHLSALHDYPALCRLIFSEVRSRPDYLQSELHAMNRSYTSLLIEVVEEGARNGEFRNNLPLPLIRDLVYGCAEHHAWRFLYGTQQLDPECIADQMTAVLCDGIADQRTNETLTQQAERLATIADRLEKSVDRKTRVRTRR